MSFGEKLKQWRKAKGMTQQELAVAAGVNVSYISNLERDFSANKKSGIPKASEKLAEKFAKILGVNTDEMLLAAGHAPQRVGIVSKPILEAIGSEGTLSEHDEILVANFIKMLKQSSQSDNPRQ